MSQTNNVLSAISSLADVHIFVVGDLILDEYVEGKVSRISPEAPVPVVLENRRRTVLGGAANVAANIATFGAKAFLCGRLGKDADGECFKRLCAQADIKFTLVESANVPTIRKTRVMAGYQQLLRLDHEVNAPLEPKEHTQVLTSVLNFIKSPGKKAVVISDYGKGTLSASLIGSIIDECRKHSIPVVTDPKSDDLKRYAGSTILKPNMSEGKNALRILKPDAHFADFELEAEAICQAVLELSGAKNVALSLSEKGVIVMGESLSQPARLPTRALKVADVSGAGDTMVAFLAMGAAAQLDISVSAEISNIAAAIVCGKLGTATLTRNEVESHLREQHNNHLSAKIVRRENAENYLNEVRRAGNKVVFTNGCFDILHPGHVEYLNKARQLGDVLVVGLNSDESVKRLKGHTRPLQTFQNRALVLAGLASTDFIIEFTEDTPLELIKECRPDVLVKGGDYDASTIVGSTEVRGWGGTVHTLSFVEGQSTSELIKRAQK